jgi:predicted PurR-regulated permease PerM
MNRTRHAFGGFLLFLAAVAVVVVLAVAGITLSNMVQEQGISAIKEITENVENNSSGEDADTETETNTEEDTQLYEKVKKIANELGIDENNAALQEIIQNLQESDVVQSNLSNATKIAEEYINSAGLDSSNYEEIVDKLKDVLGEDYDSATLQEAVQQALEYASDVTESAEAVE